MPPGTPQIADRAHTMPSDRQPPPRVLADLPVSAVVNELLAGRAELLPWTAARETGADRIEAIYTYGHPTVDAALLDRLPAVRVVSNFGVGVDHIDLKAAAARGIPVGNTPGVLDGATADLAFALLLAAGRRAGRGGPLRPRPELPALRPVVPARPRGPRQHPRHRRPGTHRHSGGPPRPRLRHDHPVPQPAAGPREADLGARYAALDDLLAAADYVVLTVPLTPQTQRLIGRAQLARMKPTAVLVNAARGAVVDTDALTEALAARRIGAAALDVTDPEPLPRDHPLLRLDNVIITPHLGSATEQTRRRMAEMSVENLTAGLYGRPLPFRVGAPARDFV